MWPGAQEVDSHTPKLPEPFNPVGNPGDKPKDDNGSWPPGGRPVNPRGTDDPGGSGDDPNAGDDPNQAQTDDPGTDPQTTNPAGTNPAGTTDPQSTVPQSSVPTPDKRKSYLEDPLSRPDPNRPGSPGSPGFPGGPGGPGSNPGGPGKSIPGGNPGQPGAPGGAPGARAASPTAGRPGMPGMGAPGAHAAARTTRASTRFPTISCRTAPPSCSACSHGCCRRAGSSADERTEFSARAAAVRRRGDGTTEWRWQLDGLAFGIVMEAMVRDRLPYPLSFRPEFMESQADFERLRMRTAQRLQTIAAA